MAHWSVPIDRLAAKMGANVETVARKVTLDLFTKVTRMSPVDTGRFKANWNFSYGQPDYTITASTNQSRGTAQAMKAATMDVGGITYLSNGLPYAARLESGWSHTQAPAGMVRISVAEFSRFVRQALKA